MVLVLLMGLQMALPADDRVEGVERPPTREGIVSFTNVSLEAGLSHVRGNFFSWGDVDNDGHQDLLVDGRRLFRNTGPPDHFFSEITGHAGIDAPVNSGVFGDFDNDGWLDIFCGGGRGSDDHPMHPDILWHNQRDGTFVDVTQEAGGISDTFPTVAGGWSDIDRDGHIDLYMVNYENGSYLGYPDNFWFNNGDGTFRNGTASSGMDEYREPLPGRGISFSDLNNDGFPDGYVSNYRIVRNYLYRNNGMGVMEEVARELGVEGHGNLHPVTRDGPYYGHSLGSSWGDLDNDGDMDLWVTNLAHKDAWRGPICDDSSLFENLGAEEGWRFEDRRTESGIPVKPIPGTLGDGDELMVSSALGDYDNDGDLDLFLPQIYGDVSYAYSYLYSNEGDLRFTDVSDSSGIMVWNTYGSAWCDYNEDGWLDLVTGGGRWDPDLGSATDHMVHLYRNNGGDLVPERNWLEIELHGRESNSAAIGARVQIEVDRDGDGTFDISMIREVQGGAAAHGQQDSMVLHFGLGEVVSKVRATTSWPMGREVVIDDLESNRLHRLFEPTEDLFLNISLIGIEPGEDLTRVDLSIHNPTSYKFNYLELELRAETGSSVESHTLVSRDLVPPGTSKLTLTAPGSDEDIVANFTISVTRSYPPLAGPASDTMVHDPLTNLLPVPVLSAPSRAVIGESMVLDGSGSYDPDGHVTSYLFDAGDGSVSGWSSRDTYTHAYDGPGTYTARLSVRDDRSATSPEEAIVVIEVTEDPNTPTRAVIDSIEPETAQAGELVRMGGHGVPSPGLTIHSYEWSSSIDGILGSDDHLRTRELSTGVQEIRFRVMDSSGYWSEPATGEVEILMLSVEDLWVSIDPLSFDTPCTGIVQFSGSSGPLERVEFVEVRIDDGPWSRARIVPEWSINIDCSELGEGEHWIHARSFGDRYYSTEYASMFFMVEPEGPDRNLSSDPIEKEVVFSTLWIIGGRVLGVSALLVAVLMIFFISGSGRGRSGKVVAEVLEIYPAGDVIVKHR